MGFCRSPPCVGVGSRSLLRGWLAAGIVAGMLVGGVASVLTREEAMTQQHNEFDPATLLDGVFERAYEARAVHTLPLVVIASSFGWPPLKPLDWLAKQPWPVFVSTKQPGHGVHSEPWGNKGREVSSFLKFFVDFYDDLPERMVFSHGHDRAWHQQGYEMQYILRNLCYDKYTRYASLNTQPSTPTEGKWAVTLLLRRNTPIANFARTELNMSTFLVSREAVRARPKSTYQTYLNLVVNGTDEANPTLLRRDMMLAEEMWHHMFGVPNLSQEEQYGNSLDTNKENGMPLVYNPIYSIENVASCPHPLCANPETPCGKAVQASKQAPIGWYVPDWSKRDAIHKKNFQRTQQSHPKGALRSIVSASSSSTKKPTRQVKNKRTGRRRTRSKRG